MPDEAAKPDTRGVFKRLMRMLRPHYGAIGVGLVLLILSGPCEVFPAQVWKFVVDDIVLEKKNESPILHDWFSLHHRISGRMNLLIASVAWLFIVYLFGEVLQTIQQNLMNRVAQKFIFNLRNRVYHKLQSQSLGYLQRQRTGDLLSRAIGDVDEIQNFIVNGIDVIIGEGFVWCITVAIAMWMDWRVASIALAPLVLVYVLLKIFNRLIKPIYTAVREKAGDIATRLQENLSGVVVIKIFAREKEEAARFEASTRAYYDQQIRAINARYTFFPFTRVVGFLSNVAMIGAGGYFILKDGSFTLGSLLAFRAYWWRLFGPVQTLARVNDMVQRAMAAAKRVFEVLDAPDELPDAPNAISLERVRGTMELRDVTFRYPTELGKPGPVVLENVSLQIHPGKTVALCGPSGSGKSTVLNLLVRFYDPASGQVLLDGRGLREIRREGLRRHFALVQQETFLFNDSILDNIRYGHGEATMEQVIAAARAANAHGFITKLPRGYETKVGERGVRLSGGQKQRISIARAFLANPAILLLDEPTSSVEPDSEATIIAALDRLMAGRTTVLTSHRPSLINQADMVYVIEVGRVTESGSPQ
ncbi:MAG TPA: ABC transporter ATP-binding protein, partial [Tepidisphaeraceae bacterium]|nr:ABC transporter ATP-binding protein [Tepidisphaeraceae bacterium]